MLSKNRAKIIESLRLKKFRQKYDLFVVEGVKALETLLTLNQYDVDVIYYTPKAPESIKNLPKNNLIMIDERMMKTISFLSTPSSVLTLVKTPKKTDPNWKRAIYLDKVQDPGNVGSIIRLADWYGIDTVIRSSDSADFYSPKAVQSTMGAFANINLIEMDREELLSTSLQMIAADMSGTDLANFKPKESFTLIMGSEGTGLHPLFQNDKVIKVTIPGAPNRISDSLNVAIATAIMVNGLMA